MVVLADEALKSKMMKEGSHLKQTRTKGGMGAGLVVAGWSFIGIGILFGAMFAMAKMINGAVALGGGCTVLGALMVILGNLSQKKRIANALQYYRDKSGYTEEALATFDTEFEKGQVVVVTDKKRLDKVALAEAGVFTEHWIKFPFMLPIHYSGLYHVNDLVAIWYQDTFVRINGTELINVLIATDCKGKQVICNFNKETCMEIINECAKRNSKVIISRNFTYQGVEYDALMQAEEVARLYQSIA